MTPALQCLVTGGGEFLLIFHARIRVCTDFCVYRHASIRSSEGHADTLSVVYGYKPFMLAVGWCLLCCQLVVTASLLLACKLEEDPRRVKSLIDVVHLLSKAEDTNVAISEDNIDDFLLDHDSTVSVHHTADFSDHAT